MTDTKGRTVDFRNTIIIMTSNVGAQNYKINDLLDSVVQVMDKIMKQSENNVERIENSFRPEFLNRVDDIIVFHKLTKEELKEIVTMMVNKLTNRLSEQNINIIVTDKAKDKIAEEGYDPEYGARPLIRAIQNYRR